MSLDRENRILGAFYGLALGDAMGMPSELWPRSRVKSYFGWIDQFLPGPEENSAACWFKAGEFTDDTSMAIALADAIVEAEGNIEPELVGRNILNWAEDFDAFNKNVLGPTSKVALSAMRSGTPISELENLGLTNGAAMRCAPLGCLIPTESLDDFIALVAEASSPTHKSDIAIAGAVVVAWAISKAIDGESGADIMKTLPSIADAAQNKNVNTFSPRLASRIEMALNIVRSGNDTDQVMEDIYNVIGAGTSTIETVPTALAMVELAKFNANRCAVLCANLGGDTDTIGAMATSLCGAINGYHDLDSVLVQQLNDANGVDFTLYSPAFIRFREERERAYAGQ